jgi:DNA-directed RNA polymerase specialized sigma24 family protein
MAMDTMPGALDMAFRTALLLTGDTRTAESAVTQGIAACEDLSPSGLLIEAVRSAARRRTKSSDGPYAVDGLPAELRRIFMLQPLLRHCFVLRILVGFSPEVCAELLEISATEFEDAVYGALIELALLRSPRTQRIRY